MNTRIYNNKLSFIEKANAIFQKKYDYSQVNYTTLTSKVQIICPIHGDFYKTPKSHIYARKGKRPQGCPQCSIDNYIHWNKDDISAFVTKSQLQHKQKYDYSKVEYCGSNTPVIIICSIHGEFKQRPNLHIFGQGCPNCGDINMKKLRSKTLNDFIIQSLNVYGEMYDYSKVDYINTSTPVIITCYVHGDFLQTPKVHLRGQGCPNCNNLTSKGERMVEYCLKANNIRYNTQFKFDDCKYKNQLKFDFYLPEYNILIEFDGEQHFYFTPKFYKTILDFEIQTERDNIKNRYANDNNIKLIRIPYTEFKNIPIIIENIGLSQVEI